MNSIHPIQIIKATGDDRSFIMSLLQEENLPTEDLPPILDHFIVALEHGSVIGVIGLEQYGHYGLLRSMAVNKNYRNIGIASQLLKELEGVAFSMGLDCLFLLTETASAYFERKLYVQVKRDEVPLAVQRSSEFSTVCPLSAIIMKKRLSGNE
jgi:amino-acid N-acetyltransferase